MAQSDRKFFQTQGVAEAAAELKSAKASIVPGTIFESRMLTKVVPDTGYD